MLEMQDKNVTLDGKCDTVENIYMDVISVLHRVECMCYN